ncbi:hypothetical protein VTK56DRAFT_8465 [Thermocarpiscus australiensis]
MRSSFGILGAAKIVPLARIWPGKTSSGRSSSKPSPLATGARCRGVRQGARRHSQGVCQLSGCCRSPVLTSLTTPSIDAVYIPLPQRPALQWTLKALAVGNPRPPREAPRLQRHGSRPPLPLRPCCYSPPNGPNPPRSLPARLAGLHRPAGPLQRVSRAKVMHDHDPSPPWSSSRRKTDIRFRYEPVSVRRAR